MVDATNLLGPEDKQWKEITTEKSEKRYRIHSSFKLGNPQRLVWGEMPDSGMGCRATYQVPGRPSGGIQEKSQEVVLVWRETSLDVNRTDIRTNFLSPGWEQAIQSRLVMGWTIIRIPKNHFRLWVFRYLKGFGCAILGGSPCLWLLCLLLQNEVNKALLQLLTSSEGSVVYHDGIKNLEYLSSENSSYIASS